MKIMCKFTSKFICYCSLKANKLVSLSVLFILVVICFNSCKEKVVYQNGTFGYDVDFLSQYQKPILLSNGNSKILLSADYQGRVLTSSANGLEGKSYGWINYNLIESQKLNETGNSFGGEDRFWLAPIGSKYSLFYNGKPITSHNWFIPKAIDSQPYNLVSQSDSTAGFQALLKIKNNVNTSFEIELERDVLLFSKASIQNQLQIKIPPEVKSVGFQSINTITNVGKDWSEENGLIAPWILGMFPGSDNSFAVFPFEVVTEDSLIVSTYLNDLDKYRLKKGDNAIYYMTDGKFRSKIGLKAWNARPIIGNYDSENKILTIINYFLNPKGRYLSCNEIEEAVLFGGDAVNCYNDEGSNGSASFFELESASEAKALKHGQSLTHKHATFHFEGSEADLNKISKELLGVSISNIEF
jgi:hypothetical protein